MEQNTDNLPEKTVTFRSCVLENLYFWVLSGISILLIVVSFLLPPTGEISPSAMQGVGELFAWGALGTVIKAIDKGKSVSLKHGNTELEIRKQKKKEEESDGDNNPES